MSNAPLWRRLICRLGWHHRWVSVQIPGTEVYYDICRDCGRDRR